MLKSKLAVVLAPLTVLYPVASFAQVDTSAWLCESCPFDSGYRATVEAGALYVSDDAARFGNATGLDEKGAYGNAEGSGSFAKEGYRLDWTLNNLGFATRALDISGGLQGKFGFDIAYREMPYRLFDSTRTVFSPAGGDSLTLPGGWVSAPSTSGFTGLSSSLRTQNIESDRQIIDLGGHWYPIDRLRVFATFQRENRDGYRISGGASFTQATLLPRWFDYKTDQVDAGARYTTDTANVGIAWHGSFFTNNNTALRWETPFTYTPGAGVLQKSVAPSNDFQQILVNGALRAEAWDTVLAFSLANGRGNQNEAFLPYTINPNISADALPSTSLDAEVDTSNYALTISAHPLPKGRVRFSYRYDDRNNKTQQSNWNRVIVDIIDTGAAESNTPYSFERSTLGIGGDLTVWKDILVSGAYERKVLKRAYQEVAEQTTDLSWGQVRWQPLNWLELRGKGGTEERHIDRYDETVAVNLGQNPLMRKYNLAYRFRKFGELNVSIAPGDAKWSLGLTTLVADDTYDKSRLGMQSSDEFRATADLSFHLSDHASAWLVVGQEEIEALQFGSELAALPDWSAQHTDTFNHYGVGARWHPGDGKFDFRIDYNRGDSETAITVDSMSGGLSTLPDLQSTLDSVRIEGGYRWSDRLYGTLHLRMERFELSDWALVAPDAISSVLTLGAQPFDYDLWAVGAGIRYNFGSDNAAPK
jgi:MtrB/PioB family decaheme-associated outer membrane protein